MARAPTPQASDALFSVLTEKLFLQRYLHGLDRPVTDLLWTDSGQIQAGDDRGSIAVWDALDGQPLVSAEPRPFESEARRRAEALIDEAFSARPVLIDDPRIVGAPDGSLVAFDDPISYRGVIIAEPFTGTVVAEGVDVDGAGFGVAVFTWSPDASVLAIGAENGAIALWRTNGTVEQVKTAGFVDDRGGIAPLPPTATAMAMAMAMAISVSGALAIGNDRGLIELQPIDAIGLDVRQIEVGAEDITAVAFDPTGRFLVSGTADGSVAIWDVGDFVAGAGDHSIGMHVSSGEVLSRGRTLGRPRLRRCGRDRRTALRHRRPRLRLLRSGSVQHELGGLQPRLVALRLPDVRRDPVGGSRERGNVVGTR